jgi:F-type H+-transporting ATPase subunit gamma
LPRAPEEGAKVLLVVFSSNKGLCGSFNANIIKKTDEVIAGKYAAENKEKNVYIYSFGKKGTDHFKSHSYQLYDSDDDVLEGTTFKKLLPCINKVMDAFRNKEFDIVEIVYNKFKNAAVQILTVEQFLPLKLDLNEQEEENNNDYIYEPSKEYIVQEMIPKSLRIHFYEAVLESLAAEHGARMTAMHKATDNATGLIKELRLKYNKARQAAITTEISEVVSGAEALKQ